MRERKRGNRIACRPKKSRKPGAIGGKGERERMSGKGKRQEREEDDGSVCVFYVTASKREEGGIKTATAIMSHDGAL